MSGCGTTFDAAREQRYAALASSGTRLSCGGAAERAQIAAGEVCVDLGCGRGRDLVKLAPVAAWVYGVDATAAMVEAARATAAGAGAANVTVVHAPFDRVPLPDGLANVVVSNCAINHAADKAAVWREVYRLLTPGGRFVVSDIYATTEVPERHRTDPVAVAECWAGAVERGEYLDTLNAAGFVDVEVLEESAPYPRGVVEVASFTVTGRKPPHRQD